MLNKNKKVIIIGIFLGISYFLITISYFNALNNRDSPKGKNNESLGNASDIITSNNEDNLTILSPIASTYENPMEGYYPGTFGFEEDATGEMGTEIEFIDDIL